MRPPPDSDTLATAQLYTDAATGQLLERSFRLSVIGGPDQGLHHPIEGGTLMVGTHPNNDVVLTDNTVSRYHLELQARREGLLVRDLDSTNGTSCAGNRLGSMVITGGARLRLGKHTELEVVAEDRAVDLSGFETDRFGNVLGASSVMRQLFALLARISPTEATLLLEGETGTGKEAIAETVHRMSNRANEPFVVVDCGAIPHELIGSELFGHAKGAFTGAAADKAGLIESANGGTLFLDEIGELALDLQPQLLRVLDKRQVRRIGENHATRVDIRVIAATHRDLRAMARVGQFREDLYYRLAVVRAVVPPLRERPDDIPLLAQHFAETLGRGFSMPPTLIEQLRRHNWPGNVRELRNVVERAISLGSSGLTPVGVQAIAPAAPLATGNGPGALASSDEMLDLPFKEAKNQLIESFEREYLTHLLARHRGNISRAAAEAGIDRNYIHRLVKKYNIPVERA